MSNPHWDVEVTVSVKVRPSQAPILDSITPASGAVGAAVTLAGSRFGTSGMVTLGGVNAIATSWSSTQIVATVPAGAVTGDVTVSNNKGDSGPLPFTVTTAPPPPPPGAELPRVVVDTALPDLTGYLVKTVKAAGGDYVPTELQAAINAAAPGTIIEIDAGLSIDAGVTGITLPAKTNLAGALVILRSSGHASLPSGVPVTEADAVHMARITSPGSNAPCFQTAPGASYYRFIGIECTKVDAAATVDTLINLGDGGGAQNTPASVPHHLIVDRCYLHGLPASNIKRGVGLHGAHCAVIDSRITEIHGAGFDTQAIGGWNGPGPYRVAHCHLEAAAENLMLGGADSSIAGNIPSDIEIIGNYLAKPVGWRGSADGWTVKNLLELKCAQRVLIAGNVLENCWAAAQAGYALMIITVNSSGGNPWATVQDVTFRGNLIRHAGSGMNVSWYASPSSVKPARIDILDNLWVDLGADWGGSGYFAQFGDCAACRFIHNTVIHDGSILNMAGDPTTGFSFKDNIVAHNAYGIHASTGTGSAALAALVPGYQWEANVIVTPDNWAAYYPAGTLWPATYADVGFVDLGGDDYRLAASSPYAGAASDGTDIGCDVAALMAAIAGVV